MKQNLCLFLLMFLSISVFGQETGFKGIVVDGTSGKPLPNVHIVVRDQNIYTRTDKEGVFQVIKNDLGDFVIDLIHPAYSNLITGAHSKSGEIHDFGILSLMPNIDDLNVTYTYVDESQMNDEDGSSQTIGNLLSSADDVYLKAASFNFSAMRYSLRGYNQEYTSTYINGVAFNDGERGRFNFSMLGGMNSLFKNKDIVRNTEVSGFGYGDIGGASNIISKASGFAKGSRASIAATNRSYVLRGTVNVASGLLPSGWAFNGGLIYRWSEEGAWDGTFYNSFGYYLGAEKIFNENHSLSLITFGAPGQRGQNSAVTQEAIDLHGDIYYNPYWGYQDGKKRNSRVVSSYDPTVILSYEWTIDENQKLKAGLGSHYNRYSSTALGFYNAVDPRPDYYRNMPSFLGDPEYMDDITLNLYNNMADTWANDPSKSQIDWDMLYQANHANNQVNPNGTAKYVVEERHNNLFETNLNLTYLGKFNRLKVTGGLEGKYSKGMHYKTMNDLLGGNQWIDVDQFSERDFPNNDNIIQNDINNPNRVIKEGDKFGYNYNMHIKKASIFAQNEWNWRNLDLYYAAKATYYSFQREGLMDNGRSLFFRELFDNMRPSTFRSYGKGKETYFITPSFKAGLAYKFDGRNRISANVLAESRAPLANNSYVSQRIMDRQISNLKAEQILSYDVSYEFKYRRVRGRLTAFQTNFKDCAETNGYYDDTYQTFINQTLSGIEKRYRGVEAAATVRLTSMFSLTAAGSYGEYMYTSNAISIISSENGSLEQEVGAENISSLVDVARTKGLYTNNGPQLVSSLALNFNGPKMWFAEIKASYFDRSYLDFSPSRITDSAYEKYKNAISQVTSGNYNSDIPASVILDNIVALQQQEKLPNGVLVDVSFGKVIYLKNRTQSLNINVNANNVLNNTKMITGGYQQGRIPVNSDDKSLDINNLGKYPNKYYYAQGFNFFVNVGYKF